MNDASSAVQPAPIEVIESRLESKLGKGPGMIGTVAFSLALLAGVIYAARQLVSDLAIVRSASIFPFIFLGVALLIALGFEFVNGFHDTANAVATVIYTHSLDPHMAVAWSGMWNFIGVLFSTGTVAFGIISLLVGWKRIVVTVGEKIGKDHLTYAQGGAAEITAMATIGAADAFGLPVSTTHVLSSGVAGTMLANKSGLQMATLRNLLIAWVLTLPVSIVLSGTLFWAFSHFG